MGLHPGDPSPWTAVTAAFVHADIWHLAGNMIFLLATGPFLEDAYGRVLFPVMYLASAICGCYAWGGLAGARFVPGIGASAAVFGVEGAFAVRFGTGTFDSSSRPSAFCRSWAFESACERPSCFCGASWRSCFSWGARGVTSRSALTWADSCSGCWPPLPSRLRESRRRINPAIEAQIGWRQNPLLVRARGARFAGNPAHARRDVRRAPLGRPGERRRMGAGGPAGARRRRRNRRGPLRRAGDPALPGMGRERPRRRRGARGAAKRARAPFAAVRGPRRRAHGSAAGRRRTRSRSMKRWRRASPRTTRAGARRCASASCGLGRHSEQEKR